jgi:glycosyltransferase involved in cell wall biosynthesis
MISVIIPVYNTAEYLPRCLDSILNNTHQNLEVICINDGSKDNSLEVLRGYAARDSRVRIIDQENAGVSTARNHGLDAATGEYIAFVDSDDWVHCRYFEVLLRCMHESGADIQICGEIVLSAQKADENLPAELPENINLRGSQTLENSRNVCMRLYRRSVIGNTRFFTQMRIAEDSLFNLELYVKNPEACVARAAVSMYYYFTRPGSAMHTFQTRYLKPLVFWYRDHLDQAPTEEIYHYFLIDGAKKLMNWRYGILYMAEKGEREQVKGLVGLFRARIAACQTMNRKNRLLYLTLLRFPNAYRLFRIATDPTMLYWERNQRQQLREAKKKT